MIPVYQILKVVRNFHKAFHLDQVVDRQTMKAMEATGGDSGEDDGEEPQDTDQDLYGKQHRKPPDDPDLSGDDGGRGRRGRHQTPLTINKWAKPLPKLNLPPRVHLQKASKVKQIWELWSVNVALAMSTWNDVAVAYWHQCTSRVRKATRIGADEVWQTDLHMRRGTCMDARHQSQPLVIQWNRYYDMSC